MTKLMEWLMALSLLLGVWVALLTRTLDFKWTEEYSVLVVISPIILVGFFGIYAVTTVLYRTFTFNNCDKAAAELLKEIEHAKADLKQKGFVFKT